MLTLKYIKDEIQKIAEAIEAVLEIDVTIVDENLVRVAGTGIYVEKIGKKVNGYSAFKKSIIEQSNILITDPSCNEICKECYSRSDCREFSEMCCPIVCEGKSYGVIGLIAFDSKQADRINKDHENLINFLGKMADLISNKLKAQIKAYEFIRCLQSFDLHVPFRMLGFLRSLRHVLPDYTMCGGNIRDAGRIGMNGSQSTYLRSGSKDRVPTRHSFVFPYHLSDPRTTIQNQIVFYQLHLHLGSFLT